MSILKFLGIQHVDSTGDSTGDSTVTKDDVDGTVQRIANELDAIPDDRALYLATFAYILGRAAHADSHVSKDETQKMQNIVQALGHIPSEQAALVIDIASGQVRIFGGTANYAITRSFREISPPEQRRELLECVFAVSAADRSITVDEETQIRQISNELGLTHKEFIQTKSDYAEHLEALKSLRAKNPDKISNIS